MNAELLMKPIAYVYSDFSDKFGVPRQSGLAQTESVLIFEPEYRVAEAIRGLEEYSHIWLLWGFSEIHRGEWKPTVRPPRLGGNKRVGVFATRSPFRPNSIGLSCVQLERIEWKIPKAPRLILKGADLMNRTPVYDIKPYLPYVDSHPEARGGFSDRVKAYHLEVDFPEYHLEKIPVSKRTGLCEILAQDPRPSYQNDPKRIYGMKYAGFDVRFQVEDRTLKVVAVEKPEEK